MATKKTTTKSAAKPAAKKSTKAAPRTAARSAGAKKAAPKAPREKAAPVKASARHPMARVKERFGSKEDLVKTLVDPLAAGDEDTGALRERLLRASNQQLLRLARVVATVKERYGDRDKLIATIGKAQNKTKDQDYLAKLQTLSLPRLLDLATATARAAKA
jgi:hypothetical protein